MKSISTLELQRVATCSGFLIQSHLLLLYALLSMNGIELVNFQWRIAWPSQHLHCNHLGTALACPLLNDILFGYCKTYGYYNGSQVSLCSAKLRVDSAAVVYTLSGTSRKQLPEYDKRSYVQISSRYVRVHIFGKSVACISIADQTAKYFLLVWEPANTWVVMIGDCPASVQSKFSSIYIGVIHIESASGSCQILRSIISKDSLIQENVRFKLLQIFLYDVTQAHSVPSSSGILLKGAAHTKLFELGFTYHSSSAISNVHFLAKGNLSCILYGKGELRFQASETTVMIGQVVWPIHQGQVWEYIWQGVNKYKFNAIDDTSQMIRARYIFCFDPGILLLLRSAINLFLSYIIFPWLLNLTWRAHLITLSEWNKVGSCREFSVGCIVYGEVGAFVVTCTLGYSGHNALHLQRISLFNDVDLLILPYLWVCPEGTDLHSYILRYNFPLLKRAYQHLYINGEIDVGATGQVCRIIRGVFHEFRSIQIYNCVLHTRVGMGNMKEAKHFTVVLVSHNVPVQWLIAWTVGYFLVSLFWACSLTVRSVPYCMDEVFNIVSCYELDNVHEVSFSSTLRTRSFSRMGGIVMI